MTTVRSRPALAVASPSGPDSGTRRRALVIGAGLGGLATATRLQRIGYQVTVLERHGTPGGRCGLWESDGFRFDTGPTLLLMVEYLRRVFEDAGQLMGKYLDLVQLDPNYRIHFADGSSLEITSRLNRMLENVERIEPGAGTRLLRFLAETRRLYQVGLDGFVDRNVHERRRFFNLKNAALLVRGRATQRLYRFVSRYFRDERLRQAFCFQSLYLGLSPFASPAIYALLAYTEMAGGLYFPQGGMHRIAAGLERLGRDLGVEYRYYQEVVAIEAAGDRVTGVRLADGSHVAADLVVANADLLTTYRDLLQSPYPGADRLDYSCSAYLMFLGVNRQYPRLLHHNLVVPADLRTCCDQIFTEHRVPADPAFYLCNPNKTDPALAPEGCENLYVLVPVPSDPLGAPLDWSRDGPRLEDAMLDRLERFGLTGLRRHVVVRRSFSPAQFRIQLGATRGEAFGLAHGMSQVGYFRPHNRHRDLTNLYFVGQSTHPGCGIPMVLISARCVTDRIREEQPVS